MRARKAIERMPSVERRKNEEAQAAVARRRQPSQRDGEQQNQQQPDPVHRERDPEVGEAEREPVGESAGLRALSTPSVMPQHGREEHRGAGELQRLWETLDGCPA